MKISLHRRSLIAVLASTVGITFSVLAHNANGTEPTVHIVGEDVGDWVVDEQSGRVFASLTGGDEVVEYSAVAGEVRRFKVGPTPTEMILKHDRLVVACSRSTTLHVIDLTKNASLGSIAVSGKGPYGLFCSDVDNGLVYCICNTGSAWWDGQVFQCDLQTMKVRKQQKIQGWGQSHALHVAMSRDGNWIVPDARGASSPSGADLMKVNEDECTFSQVRDYHSSFGQIVAGPLNRFWTFGNLLYTLDITKNTRKFAGSPVAIHPRHDLAVSRTDKGLTLERFSDVSLIATVSLEAMSEESSAQSNVRARSASSVAVDRTIQFDLANDLVFLGEGARGYWIDLRQYADKLEPLHMIRVPSEVTSLVGEPLRIPVQVTGGGDKTKVVIVAGPETATLNEGDFVWQPQAANVGFTSVTLELKSTDDERTLDSVDINLQVTVPKLDLGFHAKSIDLSQNRRYLVAWGFTPGQEDRHPAHPGSDDIAVFDLQTMKVLARKSLPQGIRCVTIDDTHVYISPNSGNLFYRFDHGLTNSERMFLQSAPTELIRFGADRLLAVGEQLQIFDLSTMKPVPASMPNSSRSQTREAVRVLSHNEIQIGNKIIDTATGKPLRLAGFADLPAVASSPQQTGNVRFDANAATIRWGRQLNQNSLMNQKGSLIAQWPGQRIGVLSDKWPMSILIASTQDQTSTTTTMELASLIDGTVQHTAIIDVSTRNDRSRIPNFYGTRNSLIVAEEQVYYLKGTEVLLATIPVKIADEMPIPTHFVHSYPEEIEVGKRITLPLQVRGSTEGATYNLTAEYPGVSLDSGTAKLTIDTQELWDAFAQQASGNGDDVRYPNRNQPFNIAHTENARLYRDLTNKVLPEDKFAGQLPISVVLRDAEGQEDQIQFSIILVGSRMPLDDAMAAKEAEQAKQMAAAQEARAKQEAERAAAMHAAQIKNGANAQADTNKRLDEIETRMRRIEAALDSILKRLDTK